MSTKNPSNDARSGNAGPRRRFTCQLKVQMTDRMFDAVYAVARRREMSMAEVFRRAVERVHDPTVGQEIDAGASRPSDS